MKNLGVGLVAGLATVLVVTFQGCGAPEHSGSASTSLSSTSAQGKAAFQSSFYAFANSKNCTKCHGVAISPRFASSNIDEAYNAARPLLDPSNPDASIFASYAGNSHCADTPCSDPANVAAAKVALEAWAAGELASADPDPTQPAPGPVSSGPKFVTSSLNLPATIPTTMVNTPAVVRFPLNQLNISVPSLSNALLEVEVQMANSTQYRFRRPKIIGGSSVVHVKGVHVYLNGVDINNLGYEELDQSLIWNAIDVNAAVVARPATLPTGPINATPLTTSSLFYPKKTDTDKLMIGFEDLN